MDPIFFMDNGISFDIFVGSTILYRYYMKFHFQWYVKIHITPQG
jgi:hypothetical protein